LEFSYEIITFLFFIAILVGFIDSIAGGGGLILIPVLLLLGFSPVYALGTSKLQSVFGKMSSVRYFYKNGEFNFKELKVPLIICFISSLLGAYCVQHINTEILQKALPWLIGAVACYFIFSKNLDNKINKKRINNNVYWVLVAPLIAFYDGFFGPASGSFFILSFLSLMGLGAVSAAAHTRLFLLVSNIAALITFAYFNHVVWFAGAVMAIGAWIGARYGSEVVHRKGIKIIKPLMLLVCFIMLIKLVFKSNGM
jgi:uncharacterized membrane protein YfcA